MRESGRYTEEELQNLDKQNAALKGGTALRQHGLNESKRISSEGIKFVDDIFDGNPQSEAWLKDKKALDEYTTGMDSLAKLEEAYMNTDSWTEKAKIGLEQLVTKGQIDWINAMVNMGAAWDKYTKQQVMDGINWLYGQVKDIPGKLQGALGSLINIITSPFTTAWAMVKNIVNKGVTGTINYVRSLPGKIKQELSNILCIVTKSFNNAWNTAKNIVNMGINSVLTAFSGLPGKVEGWMKSAADKVKFWAEKLGGLLLDIYCKIMGCSPGIVPAFKKLGQEVPRQIGKTLPHLEALSNAMNIPSTSLKVSTIPSLDSSALNSLDVPLAMPGGYSMLSSSRSVSSVSTIYNDHNHSHEPITINAGDMSRSEFKSLLVPVLEESNRRYIPP